MPGLVCSSWSSSRTELLLSSDERGGVGAMLRPIKNSPLLVVIAIQVVFQYDDEGNLLRVGCVFRFISTGISIKLIFDDDSVATIGLVGNSI